MSNIRTNDAGAYQVMVTNFAGSITSTVGTLTVLQPPVITRQPGNIVAAPGATVSFFVTVKGLTPLIYQWQKNGNPLDGGTNAMLTLTNLQMADYATYAVAITHADGWILSREATLTIAASPVIKAISFNIATFTLEIPTEVGPTYVVEYKDALDEPSWQTLTTIGGTGKPIQITDNGLTNTTRFYRVRVR